MRALNPLSAEGLALLAAVSRGEFMAEGFRNRNIRGLLFPGGGKVTAAEAKRRSAWVMRMLRLLRARRLLAKVSKTHRYQVTGSGRAAISGLLAAGQVNLERLPQAA